VLGEGAILCFSQITYSLVALTPSPDLFISARDLFVEANRRKLYSGQPSRLAPVGWPREPLATSPGWGFAYQAMCFVLEVQAIFFRRS
jgi:hypothetical protein